MVRSFITGMVAIAAMAATAAAVQQQFNNDPFPPIQTTDGLTVRFVEFATIPDADGRAAAHDALRRRAGHESGSSSATMRGMLYSVSYDGKTVTPYLDVNAAKWGIERAVAGHRARPPELRVPSAVRQRGTPGYGKFYTYIDTTNMTPTPDFARRRPNRTHDTVLLEWTAKDPARRPTTAAAPRELFRVAHPFANHNGGHIAFNPLATPGTPDFGLLYVGFADGGSGGDPFNLAQNLTRRSARSCASIRSARTARTASTAFRRPIRS